MNFIIVLSSALYFVIAVFPCMPSMALTSNGQEIAFAMLGLALLAHFSNFIVLHMGKIMYGFLMSRTIVKIYINKSLNFGF